MAIHHISARITALAALLVCSPLFAAEVKLGPEVALTSELSVRTAAYDQTSPAVASNGNDYLVVWVDGRRLGSDIYAARIAADGHPINPLGRRIGEGKNPRVAYGGDGYLIVWENGSGVAEAVQSLRVDADGAPLSEVRALGAGNVVALLSNGSTYLLVDDGHETLLDRSGAALQTVDTPTTGAVAGTVYGGRYYVVGAGPSLHTIDDHGSLVDYPIAFSVSGVVGSKVAAAFAPSAILIARSSGDYMVVRYDGSAIGQGVVP